jgi:sarcosine oxidase subunit beta
MGVSAAYHLANRRADRILLLEKDALFGQGATGTCAGGVRHQFSTATNIQLFTFAGSRPLVWLDLRNRWC